MSSARIETGGAPSWNAAEHTKNLTRRWFRADRVAYVLRQSFEDQKIEATAKQIDAVVRDIVSDWDKMLG